MVSRSPRPLLLLLPLVFVACTPDVFAPSNPPTVQALFEPTATPPVVPTPNDLAFIGGDGVHLNIVDQPTDSPAQRDFNAYLRTLNGFPSSSTAMAQFSGPIDPASATGPTANAPGSVVVFDLTTMMPLDPSTYTVTTTPDATRIIVVPSQEWALGHRFAVLVFGGTDMNGVRGANGEVVVASPTFFLLRAANPLIAVCRDPNNPACVCSGVNDPTCQSVVQGVDTPTARAAEAQREMINPVLTPLVAATGRSRSDVVLFWTFTITSQPTFVYDPTNGNIPFPNDILINPSTGLVDLPISPNDPQAALKMQLNTLDGFSVSAPETAMVDLPAGDTVDTATLVPNMTAFLQNLNPTGEQPTFAAAVAFTTTIALQPLVALVPDQNKYVALLTTQVRDSMGQMFEPPPTMVLLRSANPLFDGMHSTVNVLSDMQAMQLEQLRLQLQPLFGALAAKGIMRESIGLLWTFTTESIVRPLLAVDDFPTRNVLPTAVTLTKVVSGSALAMVQSSLPFPTSNVGAFVLGTFPSESVVDQTQHQILFTRLPMMPTPQADIFMVQPPPGDPPTTIPFWLSLPKQMPPGGAPVVVLQHGLGSWRGDMLSLADDFAKAGFAAIAFDIDLHGSRSICTSDADCASGSCTSGVCPGGLKLQTGASCALSVISGNPSDCNPVASGKVFLNPADLFATKSNFQQYVLDAAQLMRVLRGTASNDLGPLLAAQPGGLAIDPTTVAFLGTSLGGINGALFVSVDPTPRATVLNVTAAHTFDALASGDLKGIVDQYLASLGIIRGTPQYAQLDAQVRWIFDPVDPFSVARYIQRQPLTSYVTSAPNAPKPVILQEAGMDMTLPPPFQADLAVALFGPIGLDAAGHAQSRQNDGTFVSTFFPTAVHGTLLTVMPPAEGVAERTQAATFIGTEGATIVAPQTK